MHATSDYNMKTTIHEGRMWRWARSYDAPGTRYDTHAWERTPGWRPGVAWLGPRVSGACDWLKPRGLSLSSRLVDTRCAK